MGATRKPNPHHLTRAVKPVVLAYAQFDPCGLHVSSELFRSTNAGNYHGIFARVPEYGSVVMGPSHGSLSPFLPPPTTSGAYVATAVEKVLQLQIYQIHIDRSLNLLG